MKGMVNMYERTSDIWLNNIEYMYTVGKQHFSNISFNLTSPKLLPLVSNKETLEKKVTISKSLFVNASDSRPRVESTFYTKNYITVPRSVNCNLSSIADDDGFIPSGTRVVCTCINNDINQLTISDI
jgi:hypothetical protein